MYLTSLLIPSLSFKKNRIASYLLHSWNSSLLISPCLDVGNFFFSSFVYSYISFIVHRPSSIMFDERSSSSNSSSSSAGGFRQAGYPHSPFSLPVPTDRPYTCSLVCVGFKPLGSAKGSS